MAKGNLLMGTLRGKLGDSVMYVKNGEQHYRKLRKEIYNPRTAKQLIQRAIAATVLKAYGQGKEIFDHSFESKRVGGANQSRFVSLNMRRLRQYVARDINYEEAALDCQGKCVSPKSLTTTPFAFQISEGRLTQNLFVQGTDNADGEPSFKLNASSDSLVVKNWLASLGIRPGDIFTFVAFGINRDYNYFDPDDAARLETETTQFGFVTLEVIDYSQATDTIGNSVFSTIFKQVSGTRKINLARDLDATVTLDTIVGMQSLSGYWVGTLGCIRSRKNSSARSTSYMLEPAIMPWGVSSTLIVDAWQNTQILAESDLILEGGGAHRAPEQLQKTGLYLRKLNSTMYLVDNNGKLAVFYNVNGTQLILCYEGSQKFGLSATNEHQEAVSELGLEVYESIANPNEGCEVTISGINYVIGTGNTKTVTPYPNIWK